MTPRKPPIEDAQLDLFRPELVQFINPRHELVKLADEIDWQRFEDLFGATYCPDNGRPGVSTRLMVALQYLKYTYNYSDEGVVDAWVENPYFQYLSGMKWFEHTRPIDPSSISRWRKRIGEAGAEALLAETIRCGLKLKFVKSSQLERVNIDTTVQEKNIRYPTDGRLYDRAREKLVKAAQERGIDLRQNYNRKSKQTLCQQSRYAHARQMKRAKRCTRQLRTWLGRVIRDIERKYPNPDLGLEYLLNVANRIYTQRTHDQNKVYSVHEPDVECISKGKAHKRYEFGCKVSVAATSKGGWFVGAMACHGNPYDGHTLKDAIKQVERIARRPGHAFLDMGYRGHNYTGEVEVHIDKRRRGNTARSLWKWMKRRAAIEPGIGHLKQEHRMDRNRLFGMLGDKINAILSAAGMNFRKLLELAALFFLFLAMQMGFHTVESSRCEAGAI